MPILKLDSAAYAIRDLTLGSDSNGRYLSLVCSHATAYALCFSSGAPLLPADLDLSEEELRTLHDGGEIQRDRYRIQGVPRNLFGAMPTFRNFHAVPPEQIQVWSMALRPSGEAILYVPEQVGEETCYVPLRYTFQFTPGGCKRNVPQPGVLQVRLLDKGQYADGALMYQVGNALPIPLPGSWLNDSPIPILAQDEPVKVIVSAEFQGKYVQA